MKTSKACQSGVKAPPQNLNRSHRIQTGKKVKWSPSRRLMGLTLTFSTQRRKTLFHCLPVRPPPPLEMAKRVQMSRVPPKMSIIWILTLLKSAVPARRACQMKRSESTKLILLPSYKKTRIIDFFHRESLSQNNRPKKAQECRILWRSQ